MKKTGAIILLVLTAVLIVVLNNKLGMVPPVGKFLDPFAGFWHNAAGKELPWKGDLNLAGLQAAASVSYDQRGVPHIQAANDHDLYFLQGFVTARDRLWQMELQTYAAGGRLSELIGPKTIPFDRLQRRRGLKYGAEKTVAALSEIPEMDLMITSYTDGINAWISQLKSRDYPIEYKLIDYQPEPWTKLKTCLLLKYMADMLTGWSEDFERTRALAAFGKEKYDLIYPLFPPTRDLDPIIPKETPWDFVPVSIDTPASPGLALNLPQDLPVPDINPNNGSNNWAVAGSKTKSGKPILCGDPHLALNLPSIWYEIQLSAPGVNVYGVSLPGAPAIIIGFNQDIAWSVTNGSRDVQDWYQIEFKDATMAEYKYKGEWQKTTQVVEEIKVRGGKTILDTIFHTHHGPVVYDRNFANENGPLNLAMKWTAHQASAEAVTMHELNRSHNHIDYRKAIAHFETPGQNFVFACNDGDIAITQQGKFPARWPGQGTLIMDGNDPLNDWQAYIPMIQNPHVVNPERGFVSSANQHPTDATYPYDISGHYEYFRNRRINQELTRLEQIDVDAMKKLQVDNYNMIAAEVLPLMLRALKRQELTEPQQKLLTVLEAWNYFNEADQIAPSVFEAWYTRLTSAVFDDDLTTPEGDLSNPGRYDRTRLLAADSTFHFVDDKTTPGVETLPQLATQTFAAAAEDIYHWQDSLKMDATWGPYKGTRIRHIMKVAAFDRPTNQIGGNYSIVNACSNTHGPSWRMIVELGETPKAWGVFPGGPSGNPGSPFYDNSVDTWAEGRYHELIFLQPGENNNANIILTQTVNPAP
ncbi:MAG: penicillin acylase family protein [Bacteroidia bacterium]|nr:penicillin acylase family protein [Bacteroidia bacterium]